jgi:putative DNA primase/helicase
VRIGDTAIGPRKTLPIVTLNRGNTATGRGKCPRGKWKDESTTDQDTIRRWWQRWPTANIGIDCGKSGLLILDADTYKESFEGEKLLTRADEETVTTLTGGGGVHLWYKRPESKDWGNAKKGLPDGIDIRGDGGYIVAPPSLHKSGNRYAFEGGYGLTEIALLPRSGLAGYPA